MQLLDVRQPRRHPKDCVSVRERRWFEEVEEPQAETIDAVNAGDMPNSERGMWKAIGGAVAASYVAYQVAMLFYAGTLLGVVLPAEQRCESEAMKAAIDMQIDPQAADSRFDRVMKTCQGAASIASALVPSGTKP